MPKRRTKKQRDAADKKRKRRRDSKRTAELARVLSALGVLKEFRKQPVGARNRLARLRYPGPKIVLDSEAESEPEASDVAEDVSRILEKECITLEGPGRPLAMLISSASVFHYGISSLLSPK